MSTFVLVHGALHGAWCWYRVVPLLERAGHRVIVPDLPGHGLDRRVVDAVSLEVYLAKLRGILDEQEEPVVLVGHSMGGGVAHHAAMRRPEKIRHRVLLTALVAGPGQSMMARLQTDTGSLLPQSLDFTSDPRQVTVHSQHLRECFYADCADEDVTLARLLLVPQAVEPLTVVPRTASDVSRIPGTYIRCLQDRVLSPEFQAATAALAGCTRVIDIPRSHSPFFSAPQELAQHLLSCA